MTVGKAPTALYINKGSLLKRVRRIFTWLQLKREGRGGYTISNLQRISKDFNEIVFILLGPMNQKIKILFESGHPGGSIWPNPLEIEVVPFFLQAPCSSNKDIHEHILAPVLLGKQDKFYP